MSENRMQDFMESGLEVTADQIRENPVSSAMIVFGLGVAVGLVGATLLCQSGEAKQEKWVDRIGQRLMSVVASAMPSRFS